MAACRWLSVVAAILSVVYSTIGLGLSIGKATRECPCLPRLVSKAAQCQSHLHVCTGTQRGFEITLMNHCMQSQT